uniref:Uncharacterized protein n=1 Tax=Prorocentrum micans TaxID=2945 RepID=A0A7S2TCD7_PROMC|mmetsp:Transcript_2573/g.2086  ORF Transcript_2573/g.2086 Transcript_2573/m.2086 type:complete len:105 (+) Transcript_2573:100-414(+)
MLTCRRAAPPGGAARQCSSVCAFACWVRIRGISTRGKKKKKKKKLSCRYVAGVRSHFGSSGFVQVKWCCIACHLLFFGLKQEKQWALNAHMSPRRTAGGGCSAV